MFCDADVCAEVRKCIDSIMHNQFGHAKSLVEHKKNTSSLHSMCYSTISFIHATLTLEPELIEEAIQCLDETIALVNQYRRKTTWLDSVYWIIGKNDMDSFTEGELLAELCFSECLLLRAQLSFLEDESLTSFVRGALKIRVAYQMFCCCYSLLESSTQVWSDPAMRRDFESGVCLGVGMFNLLFSLLPKRIMILMKLAGFSSDLVSGLRQLYKGYMAKGLRSEICALNILGYNIYITQFCGCTLTNWDSTNQILDRCLTRYHDGALFLILKARLEQILGRFNEALTIYQCVLNLHAEWRQIDHACYWEMMFCHGLLFDWKSAEAKAQVLFKDNNWSKLVYLYCCAVFKYSKWTQEKSADPTRSGLSEELESVRQMMREVPRYKRRIAGKSIPFEKFCIQRAEKFLQQDYLPVPGLELMYLWNWFPTLQKNPSSLEYTLGCLGQEIDVLNSSPGSASGTSKDTLLCMLLLGVIHRHQGDCQGALSNLQGVLNLWTDKTAELHVPAYANVELGLLHAEQGKMEEANNYFRIAKHKYGHHYLSQRVAFKADCFSRLPDTASTQMSFLRSFTPS